MSKTFNAGQNIIDTIFNYEKKGQGFNFKDFENVVEKFVGKILPFKYGGSHRLVLDRDGKVIGGTCAHGNNQTYMKRTILYLRDILKESNATFSK